MVYVCVDESGSFNNKQERYYVISAIITDDIKNLLNVHHDIKSEICKNKKCKKELKSTRISNKQQSEFINALTADDFRIISLTIDKLALESKYHFKITEFSIYNFALKELLQFGIELEYLRKNEEIICMVDKREMKAAIANDLESYLNLEYFYFFKKVSIFYKDSATNPEIQMADYLSNAIYGYLHKSNEVYKMVTNKKKIKLKIIPDKKRMI